MKDFKFYKPSTNIEKVMIYLAIYDLDNNKYLDYETCGWKNLNEQITIYKTDSLFQTINKYINFKLNLSFKFLVVPIIEENKKYLLNLEKYCYKSNELSIDKNAEIKTKLKFTFSILFYKILPIFILVLIPANVYNFLVNNLGFVNSLIDISTISTSVIYLLNGTIYFLLEYIIYFILGMIIFIPLYALVVIYFSFYFYYFNSIFYQYIKKIFYCEKGINKNEIILEKIKFKRTIKDSKPLLKLFTKFEYYFLSSMIYILFVLFIIISTFITQIKQSNNINNNSATLISIIAYNYIKYSSFPKMSKIKLKNENTEKIVLFMGYDSTYSYYYDEIYINEILSKYEEKELTELINNKDYIYLKDIFKLFLVGKLKNSNIIAIKNDGYDFIDISNFKINSEEFLEKRIIKVK